MSNIISKADERKALEKIKNILATLGEDSYLSYAFDGCVEYAEKNIEDDAAYSLRDELSAAYAKITAFSTIISCKDAEVKKLIAEKEKLLKQIAEYKAITLTIDDTSDIITLLKSCEYEYKADADNMAGELLALLREGSSVIAPDVEDKLKTGYKAMYDKYMYYKALRERIERIYYRMD